VFVGELVDRNATSVHHDIYPSMKFMGSPREHPLLLESIELMERKISSDYTEQTAFLGVLSKWCLANIRQQKMNVVLGKQIGTLTRNDDIVIVDDLLSSQRIPFDSTSLYGIYVPSDEILMRTHYEWFARLSEKQILESKLVVSQYLLQSLTGSSVIVETYKPSWVSFWKVPSEAPVWGLKPNYLGDYVPKEKY
jgi:hypothetical protein